MQMDGKDYRLSFNFGAGVLFRYRWECKKLEPSGKPSFVGGGKIRQIGRSTFSECLKADNSERCSALFLAKIPILMEN